MSRLSLFRIRGSILHGPQRLRDHLVAAMRREPIAYVDDLPENDPDNPDNPPGPWDARQSQQWAYLTIALIVTVLTAVIPVALGATPPDGGVSKSESQTTTVPPTKPPTVPPTKPPTACEAQPCINWSPHQLDCSSDPCEPKVTVRSEGAKVLRVTGLKFTGGAADRLRPEGTCKGKSLSQGETCSITVRVRPGAAGRAQLRIQQNLPGPASLVDIEVDASPTIPTPNLDLSLDTKLQCSVLPPNEHFEGHQLTISVTVRNSGPGQLSQQVPVRLSSDTGLAGEGTADVITGSSRTPVNVDIGPDDYGQQHRFTVTVDPTGDIAEQDESNNTLEAIVHLQDQPFNEEPVKCTTR